MEIKIKNKEGILLQTQNKYVKEDIAITLDESFVQPQGKLEITEKGEHNVKEYESVNVQIESGKPEQEKSATPTKETQVVTPDVGYTLNKVTVAPIPNEYVVPTGTKDITSNGTHDVTNYESVNINVASGGSAGGTTVPNTGYIEKVYFNTELSNEEVVSILSKLTYIQTPLFAHPLCGILFSNDGNPIVIAGTIGEGDDIGYYITIITDMNNMEYVNAFDYNNLVEDGWKLNECSINKEVISEYEGLPIGTQNELIKTLVSTTPFGSSCEPTGLPIEINSIKELQQKKSAVPNDLDTYVDNIYVDTTRSTTEVEEIIDNILGPKPSLNDATAKSDEYIIAYIVSTISGGEIKFFNFRLHRNEETNCFNYYIEYQTDLTNESKVCLFDYYTDGSVDDSLGFSGWNPDFDGIVEVNSKIGDTLYYMPFGEKNALLKDFIYIKEIAGVEGAVYKVGSGKEQFSDLYINIPSSGMSNKLGNWYTVLGCETVDEKPLENIKESTQEEFYLYYDKSVNDVFVYIDIGYGLMWVDCSSMLAAADFTGLTFKGEITNINQATEEGYYVFMSSGGEVVPNSGFVKQVYLNTNLSVEKVKALIDEVVQEMEPGTEMYVVIYNGDEYVETDQLKGLMLGKYSDGTGGYQYIIMGIIEESEEYIFTYYDGSSEIEEFGFSGWNPDFKGIYDFYFETTNTAYGGMFTVGESNDKLMDLLSLTSTFGSSKTTYYLFENGEFKRFLSSDEAGLPIEVDELPPTDFTDVMIVNEVSGEIVSFKQAYATPQGVPLKCITVETEPNSDELILSDTANGVVVYYIKDRNDLFLSFTYDGSPTLTPLSFLANEDLVDEPEYTFLGTYLPGVSNKHGYYIVPGKGDVTEGAIYKVGSSDFQAYVYEEDEWMNFSVLCAVQMGGKITINLVDSIPDVSKMELSDIDTYNFVFYYVEGDDQGYGTLNGVETFISSDLFLPPVGGVVQSVGEMTDTSKMYIVGKKGGYYIYENGWKELIPQNNSNSGNAKPEQEKTVVPTKAKQEVVPDSGYTLSKVTVDAIPSEYIDTSDGTATSNDILKDKSAYVNSKKVVGTIETYNGENENGAIIENMLQTRVDATNSCAYLFYYYMGNNVDYISGLDTSKVTSMSYMFSGCSKLTTIPQLDTSSVTFMQDMFYGCSALTSVPQLDTSSVTDMNYMFYGCSNLTTIPQLDTSKVTNMESMFRNCSKLTSVPQLDTSSVTNMYYMFLSCSQLTSVPQLNTSKVTSMDNMFYNCKVLTTIDITYYNISSASNASNFAYNCTALKALIIRSFGASYVLNTHSFTNSGIANGTGYIYVPRSMVDTLKSATNWSTYANQIRALEDYTVDGTTNGELDSTKI